MSAIPFEHATIEDFNALSPCCCPAASCPEPVFAYQFRETEACKRGWGPWLKSEDKPNGFDMQKPGNLVPLYKTQTISARTQKVGTLTETLQYSSAGVVSATFSFTSTVDYDFTTTQQSAYGKRLEDWPAGSQPFGSCPPESLIFATAATAEGVSISAPDENGNVTVTLSTPEGRPDDPSNPGEKAGFYHFLVDRWLSYTSGNELEITMSKDDATCHEFQVQHVCGGYGKWSAAKVFSVKNNPCCKEPEPIPCNDFTTGNVEWSGSAEVLAMADGSWETSYSGDEELPASDSGTFSSCDGTTPSNVPSWALSSPYGNPVRPAIQYLLGSSQGYENSVTYTPSTRKEITRNARDNVSSSPIDPDDDPPGWKTTSSSDVGTTTMTDTLEWSDDQNRGKSTINGMFAEVLGKVQRFSDSYGWGLTYGFHVGIAARAVGTYPETDGFTAPGQLLLRMRQLRFRWEVPFSHDGDLYRVHWRIGKFHDRWVDWKGEYYAWAVAKHAFLTKPKPGDANYPKREDFLDKESFDAAVAEINAITDPGKAPEEPRDLRPSIHQSPAPWTWNSSQGRRPDEVIDQCDPTKSIREEGDAEERREASKRQSPWWIVTPDEWSDWRGKPGPVPPLPENPTAADRELHERRKKQYEFLKFRWENERHCSLMVCDVRRSCGDPPEGTVEEWDLRFPATELPPLSPGKEDPARWADWYA